MIYTVEELAVINHAISDYRSKSISFAKNSEGDQQLYFREQAKIADQLLKQFTGNAGERPVTSATDILHAQQQGIKSDNAA
jgi:hypothetical protein